MADLDVQRKSSNNWWIWILVAAIAAVILYFVFHGRSGEATKNSADSTTTSSQK